jgi:diguanylate cyclase (GGDEF)-like protein
MVCVVAKGRSTCAVRFFDRFLPRGLRFKILLVFLLVLIIPLLVLMFTARHRTTEAARQDFSRRLGYAGNLFRESLDDQLDSTKLRVKTVADFDFFTVAVAGFPASTTAPLMQYELIRSGLDFIAIVQDRQKILLEDGMPPAEVLPKILPAMCHSPLTSNLFILHNEPWVFAAAEITKLRTNTRFHIVFALRLARDFADRLKRLTGAEYSLLYANSRVLTTLMDKSAQRLTGQPVPFPDRRHGNTEVQGARHVFIREEALRGKISDSILLEISLPASEYADLGEKVTRDFTLFGAFGILLALVTGTFLSYHLVSPLNHLADATTRVAAGDFDLEPPLDRRDEVGILSRNFRAMAESIRTEQELKNQRMKELDTLFEISNAVNFITDSEELLKFVLTKSIEMLEAERGSIMLLDDQTDELVVKVAYGGRYRLVSGSPVKMGQGVCGLVAKDGVGRICNTGFRDNEFKNFGSLLPVEDIKTLLCAPLKFKEGTIGVINIVNKRDGRVFADNDLALLNLIASQAAVTIENNKLYELSITDGLTRLFVHRYFQARLSEELLRARRYGLKLALILLDIDNFKSFNDIYGHQIGDQVLQRTALALRDTIRTGIDIPCRYGGEELVVILPETRGDEALRTAERLREAIAALTISHPMGDLRVTVSLGVASYPADAHDKESLIEVTDRALYFSKRSGKNRSTSASDLTNVET